jgi:hypothetical protein
MAHDYCSLADFSVSACHKMAFKEAFVTELPSVGCAVWNKQPDHLAADILLPFNLKHYGRKRILIRGISQSKNKREAGRKQNSSTMKIEATCSSETPVDFQADYTALYRRV